MDNDYFCSFARYNTWANKKLYLVCAELSTEEYFSPPPSFFGSIHKTLNHIIVADLLWISRFGHEMTPIVDLDQELFKDLKAMAHHREQLDAKIESMIDGFSSSHLQEVLKYSLLSRPGQIRRTPIKIALGHFFNHQTHHRGQIHGLLSQTSVKPPSLDLIYFTEGPFINE